MGGLLLQYKGYLATDSVAPPTCIMHFIVMKHQLPNLHGINQDDGTTRVNLLETCMSFVQNAETVHFNALNFFFDPCSN